MDDYVKEHGFAGWFETSAKENINIEEAARALVNKVNRCIYFYIIICIHAAYYTQNMIISYSN